MMHINSSALCLLFVTEIDVVLFEMFSIQNFELSCILLDNFYVESVISGKLRGPDKVKQVPNRNPLSNIFKERRVGVSSISETISHTETQT